MWHFSLDRGQEAEAEKGSNLGVIESRREGECVRTKENETDEEKEEGKEEGECMRMKKNEIEEEQSQKRYMVSGSLCPLFVSLMLAI